MRIRKLNNGKFLNAAPAPSLDAQPSAGTQIILDQIFNVPTGVRYPTVTSDTQPYQPISISYPDNQIDYSSDQNSGYSQDESEPEYKVTQYKPEGGVNKAGFSVTWFSIIVIIAIIILSNWKKIKGLF